MGRLVELLHEKRALEEKASLVRIDGVEERIIQAFHNYQIAHWSVYENPVRLIVDALEYGVGVGEKYVQECGGFRKKKIDTCRSGGCRR